MGIPLLFIIIIIIIIIIILLFLFLFLFFCFVFFWGGAKITPRAPRVALLIKTLYPYNFSIVFTLQMPHFYQTGSA